MVLEWTHFALAFLFHLDFFIPTKSKLHIIFLSLRCWARRLCRAFVNPVVLLAFELQISFLDLLSPMFLFLLLKVLVFFLLWSFSCEKQLFLMKAKFWNETQKISRMHVFIDWSRYCNLSTRSATFYLLRCALDDRKWSCDFEPSNWYLPLSRKVCHLHRVWWNGRTWQTLFLVLCFLSNYIYHCCFFVAKVFDCSEEEILSSVIWIFFCVKHT